MRTPTHCLGPLAAGLAPALVGAATVLASGESALGWTAASAASALAGALALLGLARRRLTT